MAVRVAGRLVRLVPDAVTPELVVVLSQRLSAMPASAECVAATAPTPPCPVVSLTRPPPRRSGYGNDADLDLLAQLVRSCPAVAQLYVQPILEARASGGGGG